MNKIEEQILDAYAKGYSINEMSYRILGKMLDEKFVEERLRLFGIKEMYLYAGTYMAVQLYRIGVRYVSVKGIVDKNRQIPINDGIPVIALDELKKRYNGEKIIITSVWHYMEIKKELEQFVDAANIIYIGELIFGVDSLVYGGKR